MVKNINKKKILFDDQDFLKVINYTARQIDMSDNKVKICIIYFLHIIYLENKLDIFLKHIDAKVYDELHYSQKCSRVKEILKEKIDEKNNIYINQVINAYKKIIDLRNDIMHGRCKTAKYKGSSIFLRNTLDIAEKDIRNVSEPINKIIKNLNQKS